MTITRYDLRNERKALAPKSDTTVSTFPWSTNRTSDATAFRAYCPSWGEEYRSRRERQIRQLMADLTAEQLRALLSTQAACLDVGARERPRPRRERLRAVPSREYRSAVSVRAHAQRTRGAP